MGLSRFEIEVAYAASPLEQVLLKVGVTEGDSLEQAVLRSGLLDRFPQIDLGTGRIGVFGRLRDRGERVAPGDRIEIYRELLADPKVARRQRAAKARLRAGARPG